MDNELDMAPSRGLKETTPKGCLEGLGLGV